MNRISVRGATASFAVIGLMAIGAGVGSATDATAEGGAPRLVLGSPPALSLGSYTGLRPAVLDWQRPAIVPPAALAPPPAPPKPAPKPPPKPAAKSVAPPRPSRDADRQPLASMAPRTIGRILAARRGWTGSQFGCLDKLWTRESNWQVHEVNASSGAYGIPQSLPASKLATAGADWRDNPVTQITWGLTYIAGRYGTPCAAWAHSQALNYY